MFSLNRLNIAPRLSIMFAAQVVLLLLIGVAGIFFLNNASQTTDDIAQKVEKVADSRNLLSLLQETLLGNLNKVNIGAITWDEGRENLSGFESEFEEKYSRLIPSMTSVGDDGDDPEEARTLLSEANAQVQLLFSGEDRGFLEEFLLNDADFLVKPMIEILKNQAQLAQQASEASVQQSRNNAQLSLIVSGAGLIVGLILAAALGFFAAQSIINPVKEMSGVVSGVAAGDYQLRTGFVAQDEIGQLGRVFDSLLDERVTSLAEAEEEADELNDSVISLLRAVSSLRDRDLTVHVPVTEDATGPVADAINQMANETAIVLKQVTNIAASVEEAADQVNGQATIVNEVARKQKLSVDSTAVQLNAFTKRSAVIAETAHRANKVAEIATKTTKVAAGTVHSTQKGMGLIRKTIQETGKRIKHLGEFTQEISGIVEVINGIAERTTVLALNASMQAAAAGEAGRGFAVVADEVQRLAESSRKATEQIASLVKNIISETNDTMVVMDDAIGQVVEGAQQAEQAVQKMAKTVQTTGFLVNAVDEIANGTEEQARLAVNLLKQAEDIRQQSELAGMQLSAQLEQTRNLVNYSNRLVNTVSVFKLPA